MGTAYVVPFSEFRCCRKTYSSHVVKMTAGMKETRRSNKSLYLYVKTTLKHLHIHQMWALLRFCRICLHNVRILRISQPCALNRSPTSYQQTAFRVPPTIHTT